MCASLEFVQLKKMLRHQADAVRTESSARGETMMAFQDPPDKFHGFSFIPHVGFNFPSAEHVWPLSVDFCCCCKTCRRELGRHFLSHAGDLPRQPLAARRGQLRGGGGLGEEVKGGGKNEEVERLTCQWDKS